MKRLLLLSVVLIACNPEGEVMGNGRSEAMIAAVTPPDCAICKKHGDYAPCGGGVCFASVCWHFCQAPGGNGCQAVERGDGSCEDDVCPLIGSVACTSSNSWIDAHCTP